MSGNDDDANSGNRTVFRPSPLQQRGEPTPPPTAPAPAWNPPPPPQPNAPPSGWGAPPPPPPPAPPPAQWGAPPPTLAPPPPPPAPTAAAALQPRLAEDDVPPPRSAQQVRNQLLIAAIPVLAMAAGVRSGRVRTPLPELHRQSVAAITKFDQTIAGTYPEETRMRARYAVCATVDDIVQNLPGLGVDGAEWARRSMVVTFFQENIGGDRFWQLTRDMVARPAQYGDLIELYHACLAAGFEGKYRVTANGARGLHEEMTALYAALDHPRSQSTVQLVEHWKGETAPVRKVGLWSYVLLAAAIAGGVLLAIYTMLVLLLMSSGGSSSEAVSAINPSDPLRLSRTAAPPPVAPPSDLLQTLKTFLKPERDQGLVVVEEDGQTVRVRTTVGELFQSGSDQLAAGRQALFERIAAAVEAARKTGSVSVEGYADNDKLSSSASFPDNMALSAARAQTVAAIIKAKLSDPARVVSKGFGEAHPVASNSTPAGKSLNRRVEIVLPRTLAGGGR